MFRTMLMSHTKILTCFVIQTSFCQLPFCGPHTKLHGVRCLSKHYPIQFDPKMGRGTCTMLHIPCDCAECTSILEKPWIFYLTPYRIQKSLKNNVF